MIHIMGWCLSAARRRDKDSTKESGPRIALSTTIGVSGFGSGFAAKGPCKSVGGGCAVAAGAVGAIARASVGAWPLESVAIVCYRSEPGSRW